MGASIGVLAIYTNQYGDSSFTDALRVIALAGTMVGGVAAGLTTMVARSRLLPSLEHQSLAAKHDCN